MNVQLNVPYLLNSSKSMQSTFRAIFFRSGFILLEAKIIRRGLEARDTRRAEVETRQESRQQQKPLRISVLISSSEPVDDSESFGGIEPFLCKV